MSDLALPGCLGCGRLKNIGGSTVFVMYLVAGAVQLQNEQCRHSFGRLLGLLLLVFSVCPVHAQSEMVEPSPFSIRGFGTLAAARSDNANAEFLRDVSKPHGISTRWSLRDDSLVGLQANYRINALAEIAVQGVSHYRYDGSYRPELTWAFLKLDPNPRLSLRVGRIGTEFLMQSDSRMVGYSYLSIRPNVDFFGGVPINYGDGADVQVRWPVGDGVVRAGAFAGVAREELPPYALDGSPIFKGSLGYDLGAWQWRYIIAKSRLANDIPYVEELRNALRALSLGGYGAAPAIAAKELGLAGHAGIYQSIGGGYDDGTLQVQFAFNSVQQEYRLFESFRAGYVIAGYRFGSVSPFVGYSWGRSRGKTLDTGLPAVPVPAITAINEGVAAAGRRTHEDRQIVSLGARWDLARNMDLKAQVDLVRADPSSLFLSENVKPGWNGRTTVFSVALDFVF